ncbi:putative non-structural maintenance of chromosomes element 3 [Cocos nucifera]|uniref:Putative non-structural maintenance of chromosomes element 3 n=1 Tax=Cocos nucifera TaxID=13894 RepID=A0A8K0I8M1_COCNU|nr:putative non-structural maintenance of chromosomes element 3 [Cocos nucifera]
MESLAAIAATLLSSKHVSPSDAPPPSPSSLRLLPGGRLLNLLRRFLLLFLHAVLSFLLFLLSPAFSYLPSSSPAAAAFAPGGTTAADRALAHVLSTVSRVPVASRKYELVRSLADRLLDDNLRLGAATGLDELNRAALSSAFSRTLQRLEAATVAAVSAAFAADRSLDMIIGVVRSGMRRFAATAAAVPEEGDVVGFGVGGSAEKLAAEALWLGQKMAECGAAPDAVARWGAAAELGRLALSAEPRLQVEILVIAPYVDSFGRNIGFIREKDKLVAEVIRHVLFKTYQSSGCPIKREDLTQLITKNYRQRALPAFVINEAREKLSSIFGYEMKELQRSRPSSNRQGRATQQGTAEAKSYVLVSKVPSEIYSKYIEDKWTSHVTGFTFIVISIVHLAGGKISEENLWHQLRRLGLNENDENHPFFGNTKQTLEMLVQQRYLLKEKVNGPEGNAVLYELAERALDESIIEKLKDYIAQTNI